MVEHRLPKARAAGSNPVSRFDIEKISKKLLTNNDKHDILLKLSALIKNAGNNMNIDN